MEGIELGKYQLVFASAEKVFVKPFLLLIRKKKIYNIPSEYNIPSFHQTNYSE